MNRKDRRAAARRGAAIATAAPKPGLTETTGVADLMAAARQHYQLGRFAPAEDVCRHILAREPSHVNALNLLGLIAQGSGLHKRAVGFFGRALAQDEGNAACHYNIASSYLALNRRSEAAVHFRTSIALGLSDKDIEHFIVQNPAVAACVERVTRKWPLPVQGQDLFGAAGLAPFAGDVFLQCAMASTTIRGLWLETIMTHVRAALLGLAAAATPGPRADDMLGLFCALAQQCFINEYIFALSDEERRLATQLRSRLLEEVTAGHEVQPFMLAAVAAYHPLHSLPIAEALLARQWPEAMTGLLRQQIGEPLEERRDRVAIPAVTAIENSVSLRVMNQYDENPYPRWTVRPYAIHASEQSRRTGTADGAAPRPKLDILIAGCGTGRQAILTGRRFPNARILAVGLSAASLAYARRKTREEGVRNIDYAQGDILELGQIGRTFDRIESVGVLHHLADPKAGWRVLLSLLRPGGEMDIGLYSETARRSVVGARALIAERGYRATDEDIRGFRQEIFRIANSRGWNNLTLNTDFYSMSGCRDLLFNVMEHRFTIPQIKALLTEFGLSFAGFELEPVVLEKFKRQFTDAAALTDLECWHAFEQANPDTFRSMYQFLVRKD